MGEIKSYQLLNKDEVLSSFEISGEGLLEKVENVKVSGNMPFWISNISEWLENRSAAKHRQFVKDLLKKCGAESISGFISLTNCLSLQDTLWVRAEDSELTWDKVNLFDNEFSEVMTHLAFDGTGLYGAKIRTTSPELTTDGNYDKCWVRRNGDTILLKAGSTGARNAGLEPYCEFMASQFYERFCDSVTYGIETYRNKVVSSCKSFVDKDYGYKPISLWMEGGSSLPEILNIIEKNNGDVDEFRRIVVADSVVVNSDRHFGNFGFLTDNNTYEVLKLAPAFDFNMALSPYAEFDIDFPIYDEYLSKRGPVLAGSYIELAKTLLTSEIRSDLIALKDLEFNLPEWCFEPHKYQFTKERLDIYNEVKNVQINRILGIESSFSFATGIKEEAQRF